MSENVLLTEQGEAVYTWRNQRNYCHSNGRHDLLFTTELYDYSVLKIEGGRDFHYLPSKAHPGGDEAIIWCDAAYV